MRDVLIYFLDKIKEYEQESGNSIYKNGRESSEIVDIYLETQHKLKNVGDLIDFYMWMQENDYDHNIRERVEKKAKIYLNDINIEQVDPALKLAGKLAIAAETVINSKMSTVSTAITMLEDALNNYNNEILSRIK